MTIWSILPEKSQDFSWERFTVQLIESEGADADVRKSVLQGFLK